MNALPPLACSNRCTVRVTYSLLSFYRNRACRMTSYNRFRLIDFMQTATLLHFRRYRDIEKNIESLQILYVYLFQMQLLSLSQCRDSINTKYTFIFIWYSYNKSYILLYKDRKNSLCIINSINIAAISCWRHTLRYLRSKKIVRIFMDSCTRISFSKGCSFKLCEYNQIYILKIYFSTNYM